jgi:hypothetical protein
MRVHETGDGVIVIPDREPAAVSVDAKSSPLSVSIAGSWTPSARGLGDVEAGLVLTTPEPKQWREAELGPSAWG